MKDFAKRFYRSKEWQACRAAYINKRLSVDGGLCEVCHLEQGYIVHHKEQLTPLNIDNPNITLNFDNLSYECKGCHDKHEGHGVGKGKQLSVVFDNNGMPIKRKG